MQTGLEASPRATEFQIDTVRRRPYHRSWMPPQNRPMVSNMLRFLPNCPLLLRTVSLVGLFAVGGSSPAYAAGISTGIPRYDAAVAKGVGFLKGAAIGKDGQGSLIAYTLLKAGESAGSPKIQEAVKNVRAKTKTTGYTPSSQEHHVYEAGCDLLLLTEADPDANYNQIMTIVDYLIRKQDSDGAWDYPTRDKGDTSMAQYAVLGLWAASRAGVEVPLQVFDLSAQWHIRTQMKDGGFSYHPNGKRNTAATGGGKSTLSMTASATGTLGITRIMLYGSRERRRKKPKKFDVLESVEIESPADEVDVATANRTYNPITTVSALDSAIGRGLGWLTTRFRPVSDLPFTYYYDYALERACAVNNVESLGGKIDWYRRGGDEMLKRQTPTGLWSSAAPGGASTCFCVLFYLRSTGRMLGKQYGTGLMAGGRDLPDNLATFDPNKPPPKPGENQKLGPLDELLAELVSADLSAVEGATQAIVEKVQLGDREELIGQIDYLKKLATHPDAEVRRTALWALGRSGDIRIVPMLINALDDNNVDVMIEARSGLCAVSRKSKGFGLPSSPFLDLTDTTDEGRTEAANKWRADLKKAWNAWWFKVRPYDLRDSLTEALLTTDG